MTVEAPENLVVDFDVYDQNLAMSVDVFQARAAELREKGPVVYSPAYGGHWIVTRYEEAHQVLRDPGTFSSYPNNLVDLGQGQPQLPLELDPPQHGYYRNALQPLFSAQRMHELEPSIRQVVSDLIDGFAGKGKAEFIADFAHEVPARVFLTLMGWPVSDGPMFTEMTDIALTGIPGGTAEESDRARAEAAAKMFAYFGAIVQKVRAGEESSEGITAQIINTPVEMGSETRLLTEEELSKMFFLLLIAGLHTVQGSLAWGIIHLSANPDQRQEILDDPDLIPSMVEEILRIDAAVSMGRRATRDVELGGVQIKEGDKVLMLLSSVNRDEGEFEEADQLKGDRFPNRHLAFGAGPHRCIGSHLARIELKLAFEELHARIPDYELIAEDPPVMHASQVRGCVRLPITFTPEG
jgi:cytochrome P450